MKSAAILFVTAVAVTSLFGQQPSAPAQHPQEPKNVLLLKGLSPTELIRTMQFMSASLGVGCDFCHVLPPNGERDFASDAKEEKKTARAMIQLVLDTNAKFFKNNTEVTCMTCHRGSPRPVGVPVLPVAQPAPAAPAETPATAQQKPAVPSRDEIVSKYAKALGNPDGKTVQTLELKGTRETSRGSAPIDVFVAPGKTRIATSTPEGEMVTVVNGNAGWMRDPKGTHAMQPMQLESTEDVLDALRLPRPSEIPADARVSKGRLNDKDVWIVTSPYRTTGRQRLYFDPQTGLLLRRMTLLQLPVGSFPQQTDFDDYRDVGGFKIPYTVTFDSADRGVSRKVRYDEVRLNPKIDDSVFVQPQ
jgi:photosynthetic reaction center cytochrome c subunit